MTKRMGTLLDTVFNRSEARKKKYFAAKAKLTNVDRANALQNTSAPTLRPLYQNYKRQWYIMIEEEEAERYKTAFAQVAEVRDAIQTLIHADENRELEARRTLNDVQSLSADELQAKPNAVKIRMLARIRSTSYEMTSEQRAAQRKIYNAMELDQAFLNHDAGNRAQVADAMTDTPEKKKRLKKLNKNWKKAPNDGGPTQEQKVQLMRDAIAVQCQVLGIDPPPEVVTVDKPADPDGAIDNGYFDPNDGKIYINTNLKSSFHGKMAEVLDLALHENSHNYQHSLVKKLEDGTLKEGDPEYEQALLFQANIGPGAYVEGKEDFDTYKKQPLEKHAHRNGPKTAKAIMKRIYPDGQALPAPARASERS